LQCQQFAVQECVTSNETDNAFRRTEFQMPCAAMRRVIEPVTFIRLLLPLSQWHLELQRE
jgi:hypothetical protein